MLKKMQYNWLEKKLRKEAYNCKYNVYNWLNKSSKIDYTTFHCSE